MKRFRTIGAGLGIILTAALIAGCGGGASQPASTSVTSGTTPVTPAVTAQTAALTVTVTVPSATTASSARRTPAYVSPATTSITAYALPSNIYASANCSGSTCSVTIAAPLTTTSIEVQLYGGGNLLSEATEPVTITAGVANTPAPLVFNGVVSSFQTATSIKQAVIGAGSQPFTVTLTPLDAAGNHITGPGGLFDASGDTLVSANGSTQTFSLGKSGTDSQYLTLSALTFNSTLYALTATGTYSDGGAGTSGTITITPSTTVSSFQNNSPVTPLQLAVNPKSIQIVANPTDPPAGYQLTVGSPAMNTTTAIELGTYPTPAAVPVYLTVIANFNDAGAHLALGSDSCSNLSSTDPGLNAAFPSPGPTMPATLSYPFTYNVTGPAPNGNNVSCAFTITDTTNNLTATANVGLDNTTLTVSGKARK